MKHILISSTYVGISSSFSNLLCVDRSDIDVSANDSAANEAQARAWSACAFNIFKQKVKRIRNLNFSYL